MSHLHQPRAGIVSLECNDDPALGRKHCHISSDRVVAAQARRVRSREIIRHLAGGWVVGRAAENNKVMSLLETVISIIEHCAEAMSVWRSSLT